jgi:hypothetical protein
MKAATTRRILLLLLAAASTACAEAAATAVDPCSLLTREEITAAVKRPDLPRGKRREEGLCFYSSARGSVSVWAASARSKADFDGFRRLLENQGQNIESVSGIGDAAYFWDDRLYARVGTDTFTIQVSANPLQPSPPGAVRPVVLSLARLASVKLRQGR